MRRPSIEIPLIQASFVELEHILGWLEERRQRSASQRVLLVGGWAVHMYNAYYGSYDIDLLMNSTTKKSLEHHLTSKRGYRKDDHPFMGPKGVVLDTPAGGVHLDTAAIDGLDRFEGVPAVLDLSSVADSHQSLDLGDVTVPVPERSRLLLMKLKAAWDRGWRLDNGTSRDPDRERGKLVKDLADVLALVDPASGGREVDFVFLGAQLERYPFLADTLGSAGRDPRGVEFYGKLDMTMASGAVEEILRLVGRPRGPGRMEGGRAGLSGQPNYTR